jgi:hypothetical protein
MAAPNMETAGAESFIGSATSSTSAVTGSETQISDSGAASWHPGKHKL